MAVVINEFEGVTEPADTAASPQSSGGTRPRIKPIELSQALARLGHRYARVRAH